MVSKFNYQFKNYYKPTDLVDSDTQFCVSLSLVLWNRSKGYQPVWGVFLSECFLFHIKKSNVPEEINLLKKCQTAEKHFFWAKVEQPFSLALSTLWAKIYARKMLGKCSQQAEIIAGFMLDVRFFLAKKSSKSWFFDYLGAWCSPNCIPNLENSSKAS